MSEKAYSVDQIIGKTLFAKRDVSFYSLPDKSKKIGLYKAGDMIGTVYSYIQRPAAFWWQIDGQNGKKIYVIHNSSDFDIDILKQQGAKSVEEIAEEKKENEMTFSDKLLKEGGKIVKWAGIGVFSFLLIKELLLNGKKNG